MGIDDRAMKQTIQIECSAAQLRLVDEAASQCGQGLAEFIWDAALVRAAACPMFGPTVQVVGEGTQQ